MKKTFAAVTATLLIALPVSAELKLSVVDRAEKLSPPRGKVGSTIVAAGNSKGQTFTVKKTGKLEGLLVLTAGVVNAADLTVSIYRTETDYPVGDALHSESGRLPKGAAEATLKLEFESPLQLETGSYALVLSAKESDLRFTLGRGYTGGRAIRNNKSSEGRWASAGGKDGDFTFSLLGIEAASKSASQEAPSVAGASVKLLRHTNPPFTPVPFNKIRRQPNIVTVMVDDLGWNQIGVEQSTMGTNPKLYRTPNLMKLAAGGLSFTSAYAQPNCAPTRAAMLSGQYPARIHNDVYCVGSLNRYGRGGISKEKAKFTAPEQTEDVAAEAITVAEAMRKNGYATAHIGKYHVGGHGGEETLPENAGFDINIGGFTQGHQPVCFASKDGDNWVFRKLGRGHFDRFAEPYTGSYLKQHNFPLSLLGTPKHVSDALSDAMEETIGKFAGNEKPFYLQLHPYAVHGPVRSRPDLKASTGDELAGFVASIDLTIGRLLKVLNDTGCAENTLILFTSDNGGTHKDNLPLRGKKGMFTEGGIRVPLIAYWPGVIPANTVTDHMVHTVDYYPTYLQFAGDRWMPPEAEHPLDGESFVDVLLNPNTDRMRDPIFYLFPGYMDSRAQPTVAAIDEIEGQRYKLLYFYEANDWELYNLSHDIGENTNLIKTHTSIAAPLSQKIHAWLSQKHSTWNPKYPLKKKDGKSAGPPPSF